MGHTAVALLGLLIMVTLIVVLDVAFLRHRFVLRLIVNVAIVAVFAVVYLVFIGRS
ncbi:hypothetical protein ABCS02_13120 [Microbacterium sp. X-17]|uniref:hypothetical protein n=1 Tax=Microbacterium sp. X-17 TaxID=3144404 RepID=UPI0031F4EFA9